MTEMGFDGRVAVVSGGGRGLGREHALLLAERGAHVVVNDTGGSVDGVGSDPGPAHEVVRIIDDAGGSAIAAVEPVDAPGAAESIVQLALDTFGNVDIVVNNAGILQDKSFGKMSQEMVDAVLSVHLKGAFALSQAAWHHMREQGYGRIVNVTSTSGLFGNFGQANYAAAKMGVVGLTKVLAIEGARHGVKANAIAPGALTRMTDSLIGEPLRECLRPAEVSPVVGWLAHEDCPVTGEIFSCGGGRVARVFVAVTSGFCSWPLTMEAVRDHMDEIFDPTGAIVPHDSSEELELLMALVQQDQEKPEGST